MENSQKKKTKQDFSRKNKEKDLKEENGKSFAHLPTLKPSKLFGADN